MDRAAIQGAAAVGLRQALNLQFQPDDLLAVAAYVMMALAWSTPGYVRSGMETYWFSTWTAMGCFWFR